MTAKAGTIMSQTTAAKKSSPPKQMIIVGILTAIAGWGTRNYAASMMDDALIDERARELPPIPGYEPDYGPTVESVVLLGNIGSLVLTLGVALAIAGLIVIAFRTKPLRY
jgi:hypothetical protein